MHVSHFTGINLLFLMVSNSKLKATYSCLMYNLIEAKNSYVRILKSLKLFITSDCLTANSQ